MGLLTPNTWTRRLGIAFSITREHALKNTYRNRFFFLRLLANASHFRTRNAKRSSNCPRIHIAEQTQTAYLCVFIFQGSTALPAAGTAVVLYRCCKNVSQAPLPPFFNRFVSFLYDKKGGIVEWVAASFSWRRQSWKRKVLIQMQIWCKRLNWASKCCLRLFENAPVEFRSRTEPPKTQITSDERSLIPIESFFRKILLYDLFSEICL